VAENVVGSVVGKVRFNIDKASWDNLASFQAKLSELKTTMSSMDKSIKVNAVVQQIDKVANATVNAEKKVAAATQKYSGNVRTSNKNADMNGRLAHLFPATALSSPASRTMFAQMLRDEDRAAANLIKQKDKHDAQQAKQTAKANRNRTAFEASVENFMLIKEGQINQYATQRKLSHAERQEMMSRIGVAKDQALKSIDPTQAKAIESFRAQVNKVKNEMVTSDRVARANAISFKSLRNEIVQLTAAYTAFTVVQNIAQDGMALEGIRAAAKVFTGSDAGTAEHMEYLVEMTDRLGVNFMTAAKEFNKFSIAVGSKADQQTQRHIFEGLSEYATVLQVDQQQYERGIRSVVQMFSKEQVYAEELRGQLAEALPGSVAAMMRASGFTSEKDFFKAVEAGKIMASEVMPKFADELKKIARSNGALEATTKKTRAEMQRFFNQLTYAKDAIFQGGMDDGLGYMFNKFSDSLETLKPLAKALGGVFKGAISVVSGAIKLILTPLEILTDVISTLWSMLGADTFGIGSKMWAVIGAGGTLAILATKFKLIQNAIGGANVTLIALMRNMARLALIPLVIEDTYGFLKGKDSLLGTGADALGSKIGFDSEGYSSFGNQWRRAISAVNPFSSSEPVNVTVTVKDGEFSKVISAAVDNRTLSTNAINQMETSQ
jgi:tape measure domain-containing protein